MTKRFQTAVLMPSSMIGIILFITIRQCIFPSKLHVKCNWNSRCRFVKKDNWRVVDQLQRNGQSLPLSTWQTFSSCVATRDKPEGAQYFIDLRNTVSRMCLRKFIQKKQKPVQSIRALTGPERRSGWCRSWHSVC